MLRSSSYRSLVRISTGQLEIRTTGPYIFQQDGALITTPVAVSQNRDEPPRVHFQQGLGLLVRVYFDILIRESLELQRDPDALRKRTGKENSLVSRG